MKGAFDQHILGKFSWKISFRASFTTNLRCGHQLRLKRVRMADPDLPSVDDNGADLDGLSLMGLVNGWVRRIVVDNKYSLEKT